MFFYYESLFLQTKDKIEVIDITSFVVNIFERSLLKDGYLNIYSPHTTAFISLNESEPKLILDMVDYLTNFINLDKMYRHNLDSVDNRENASSHLLGLFMNSSETIPVSQNKLFLGNWQSVFFIELDGPRDKRMVQIQCCGNQN